MTSQQATRVSEVWCEVESWPVTIRLTLASRILQSVERTLSVPEAPTDQRRQALLDLIGIWKTDSPPSDEDVERILEDERLTKYR